MLKECHLVRNEQEVRMAVVGENGSGKSSIVIQYISNCFFKDWDWDVEDSYRKGTAINKRNAFVFDILDTVGPLKESEINRHRTSHGFMIVYSIASRDSFSEVIAYREDILKQTDTDIFAMILVGNKCDLKEDRQVAVEEGIQLARSWNIPFFEITAKDYNQVKECFFELFWEIVYYEHSINTLSTTVRKRKSNCKIH
eukprot:TRINITY_DN6402_c0_g1_i1.p1 TRINITY_DN6402_c0_g1~~TRINITY_DN6402_c0_g1_i1.p1  ORF type:complete len:198 (-),score=33.85 TRINITY_DN6402_c0_g1_i1:98-691(-)